MQGVTATDPKTVKALQQRALETIVTREIVWILVWVVIGAVIYALLRRR